MGKLFEVVKDLLANPMISIPIGFALAIFANLLTPAISRILSQRSRKRTLNQLLRQARSIRGARDLKRDNLHTFRLLYLFSRSSIIGLLCVMFMISTVLSHTSDPLPIESLVSAEVARILAFVQMFISYVIIFVFVRSAVRLMDFYSKIMDGPSAVKDFTELVEQRSDIISDGDRAELIRVAAGEIDQAEVKTIVGKVA